MPKGECGGVGFEPTTTSLGELNFGEIDWDAKYCVNYAKKYAHCLLKKDFSEVRDLPKLLEVTF